MNKFPRFVWLINEDTDEKTLAYFYNNPDAKQWGYGFNIADGGGFLPENDLTCVTTVKNAVVGVELPC